MVSNPIPVPRLSMMMSHDPVHVINPDIVCGCAKYIRDNCDERGYFNGGFSIGDGDGERVYFEVSCRLLFSPFEVVFYFAEAVYYDEEGKIVPTDFNLEELKSYLYDDQL